MKGKYEVTQYIGVPLESDDSGQYQLKFDDTGAIKFHSWRTGKHTKGKFKALGQVFMTENHLRVVIVKTCPVAFKDRHEFTPLQRFTNEFVSKKVLTTAQTALKNAKTA